MPKCTSLDDVYTPSWGDRDPKFCLNGVGSSYTRERPRGGGRRPKKEGRIEVKRKNMSEKMKKSEREEDKKVEVEKVHKKVKWK